MTTQPSRPSPVEYGLAFSRRRTERYPRAAIPFRGGDFKIDEKRRVVPS